MSVAETSRKPAEAIEPGIAMDPTSVRFSVVVRAPLEHAFRVFTERFDSWWPRDHHIGRVPMAVAVIEPRPGGRWYELGVDGSECDWGVVLAWEADRHIALSWHLDGDFRYHADPARASRVDVWFEAREDGTTEVLLEHSGLEAHGPTWRRLRDSISRGWPTDLRRFAQAVESRGSPEPRSGAGASL